MSSLRSRVIKLYKELYHMGKDYPAGATFFHTKLKNAFLKNKDVTDPKEIEVLIKRGEFVVKEVEALYMLKKYRAMKQNYYEDSHTLALNEYIENASRDPKSPPGAVPRKTQDKA